MERSKERRNFLVIVAMLLIMSLVAAAILFYFLESFAKIENKGVTLGGAAAGFVVIFILLRNTYFRVSKEEKDFDKASTDDKITQLQDQIKILITSKLEDFNVPKGYRPEISQEFKFGFCYPQEWEFSRFPQQTMYGFARDVGSGGTSGFARNVNVVITDISGEEGELSEIYKSNREGALNLIPNAKLVFSEDSMFMGLPAMRYRIDYVTNDGKQLALYQILTAEKDRKNLFIISFTTLQADFVSSKILFDNIASTFRI